jgi:hypothetical protein
VDSTVQLLEPWKINELANEAAEKNESRIPRPRNASASVVAEAGSRSGIWWTRASRVEESSPSGWPPSSARLGDRVRKRALSARRWSTGAVGRS